MHFVDHLLFFAKTSVVSFVICISITNQMKMLFTVNGEKKISLVVCHSESVCKNRETVYKRHTIMQNLYKGRVWFNKNVYLISMSLFVPTWGAKCYDTAPKKEKVTPNMVISTPQMCWNRMYRYMCTETWMTMKCMMTSRQCSLSASSRLDVVQSVWD